MNIKNNIYNINNIHITSISDNKHINMDILGNNYNDTKLSKGYTFCNFNSRGLRNFPTILSGKCPQQVCFSGKTYHCPFERERGDEKMSKNMFCEKEKLENESDIEQFFVIELLKYLGFTQSTLKSKKSLHEIKIGKGSKKINYKPDYICYYKKEPKIVVEAKSPFENIDEFTYQISGYALEVNKRFKGKNPIRYTLITNGLKLKLYQWDEEEPILDMNFEDFTSKNKKLEKLYNIISHSNVSLETGQDEISIHEYLTEPSVEQVKSSFNKCHNTIWKKEKISPTDAFYEFTKIIFVKLNEDKRIRELIQNGKNLKTSDFKFSVNWLEEREKEMDNPFSSILFSELQRNLSEEIRQNEKKPIFLQNEGINLKAPTIKEVVKILQNYDLYTIDEDLNGRMFETFLNATIRGRELGQYFTPRKIVKFMTKLSDLRIWKENEEIKTTSVLDACCGSGGFLIDALADLIEKSRLSPSLIEDSDKVQKKIKKDTLFGIEGNPKITRIARINMYAHGDGGSRIYCADSLDKNISIQQGTSQELRTELEELKTLLNEDKRKFNVILTNPPFSMAYRKKDEDEKKILEQYSSHNEKKNISLDLEKNTLKASVKSNVLFLARYLELMEENGKMFIILDNSVLNSDSHKEYRDFIRKNFIIKAIFQLPTHAFVNQEAGGITSILYLKKRKDESQSQPPIFARMIQNIGHTKAGKEENFDDFNQVLEEFNYYEKQGKILKAGKEIGNFEDDEVFLIEPSMIDDRLDIIFYQPSYHRLIDKIKNQEKQGKIDIKYLSDFDKGGNIDDENLEKNFFKYTDIGVIDKERGFINTEECEEGFKQDLPNRAKILLKKYDVVFSKPFRSLRKVAIVPEELHNELASTGFYTIRTNDYNLACILWSVFRSNLIQKQLEHLASGYTQRELNEDYLNKFLLIPVPKNSSQLSEKIDENINIAKEARKQELDALKNILTFPKEFSGIEENFLTED